MDGVSGGADAEVTAQAVPDAGTDGGKETDGMCGIAGFCSWGRENPAAAADSWERNIRKMNDRMKHRGPDASGIWASADASVVLGHRRLAIIDLSETGAQPMISHSGRYVIAFNGEIYNYKEIAQKLLDEKKTEAFRGSSDTEVLLEAAEHYGVKEAVSMCRGMFAIALYDQKEKLLYLVRDRVGEKPLYYGFVRGSFVFASDLGSIAVLDGFEKQINREVLDIYFTHGYIPAPYSIYRNISKLKPGCILTIRAPFEKEGIGIEAYWSMKEAAKKGQSNLFQGSRKEAADELERLLKRSIEGQMTADVPVGAFLSAGIDSSTVVALMQSLHAGKVRSFTIGMEDKKYNEAEAAREIAAHLGTEHTELYITEKDAKAVIPQLAEMFSEPFADSSQIPTYLVSRMTREHVTVSLSGDGGDELFCGYTSYVSTLRAWERIRRVPGFIRYPAGKLLAGLPFRSDDWRIRGKLLQARDACQVYQMSYETNPLNHRIALERGTLPYYYTEYEADYLPEQNHNIMLMDMLMYHPDDILVKVDRTAMAVSLETRVPMLDKDVVEFAWSLPVEYKRSGENGKLVLRDVLYRYVPKEMMDRPKKGFSIPVQKWLKEPSMREWAESLIDRRLLQEQGLLNPDVVWNIWKDFQENGVWRKQIWYILMFQEWMMKQYAV